MQTDNRAPKRTQVALTTHAPLALFAGKPRVFYRMEEAYRHASREGTRVDSLFFGVEGPVCAGTPGTRDAHCFATEVCMTWYAVSGGDAPSPRLEVFNDAFALLLAMPDVLVWLAEHDGVNFSPAHFSEALKTLGFVDVSDAGETCSTAPAAQRYLSAVE